MTAMHWVTWLVLLVLGLANNDAAALPQAATARLFDNKPWTEDAGGPTSRLGRSLRVLAQAPTGESPPPSAGLSSNTGSTSSSSTNAASITKPLPSPSPALSAVADLLAISDSPTAEGAAPSAPTEEAGVPATSSGSTDTAGPNNQIFESCVQPNPCDVGPTYWCASKDNYNRCMQAMLPQQYQQVGVCGYATANCTQTSLSDFCDKNKNATRFNGGINGSPTGYFGYYALAMTWVPSSCRSNSTLGGFCSAFTTGTSYSANHLVLHGLWPDYGSLYAEPGPQPPFYNGTQASYQGWPQWCDGSGIITSQCAVGPNNRCLWANKTIINQNDLETCLRQNNITECLVPDSVTDVLGSEFERIAPGYLSADRKPTTFLDHEYFKHGSCVGGYLAHNITAYFDTAVKLAYKLTGSGTPADRLVHKNVGGKVLLTDIEKGLNQQAVPTCKKGTCNLDEVWYCLGRDAAGFPTELIKCPVGTLASNTCASQGCEYVNIPAYQ